MKGAAEPSTLADDGNCGKDPTALRVLTLDGELPTTSNEVSGSGPALERNSVLRRQYHINLTGELFRGIVEASKRGVHPVIRYPIPGGEYCYVFEQVRTTKQGQVVYRCTRCKKNGSTTSIAVKNGCDFIGDPALLPHVCAPLKNAQDKVTRMVYQSCQAIASESQLAQTKPSQLWQSIAQFIDDNAPDDEAERKVMLKYFYRGGYKSRRRTIARAAARLHDHCATTGRRTDTRDEGIQKIQTLGLNKCL